MIQNSFLTEWRANAPWLEAHQVEQDLVISKALIQIYSDEGLKKTFAFRGGTSLQKIFFRSPTRYSEDIDLVQVPKEPIGPAIDRLRKLLDPWLGKPKRDLKDGRVVLKYSFQSEGPVLRKMRLKIEINNAEHLCILGHKTVPYSMQSGWFSGQAEVLTFEIEEILGTKLRALYQRKKGRDLYDMSMAYHHIRNLDDKKMVQCFHEYMKHEGHSVSRAQYEANLHDKLSDPEFLGDIQPLLKAGAPKFDMVRAGEVFRKRTLVHLHGEPWAGS